MLIAKALLEYVKIIVILLILLTLLEQLATLLNLLKKSTSFKIFTWAVPCAPYAYGPNLKGLWIISHSHCPFHYFTFPFLFLYFAILHEQLNLLYSLHSLIIVRCALCRLSVGASARTRGEREGDAEAAHHNARVGGEAARRPLPPAARARHNDTARRRAACGTACRLQCRRSSRNRSPRSHSGRCFGERSQCEAGAFYASVPATTHRRADPANARRLCQRQRLFRHIQSRCFTQYLHVTYSKHLFCICLY